MSDGFRVCAVPTPKLTLPVMAAPGRINRLLAPMLAMVRSRAAREPCPISVMAMTAATPMMTPSPVSAERILFRLRAPSAVRSVDGMNEAVAACRDFGAAFLSKESACPDTAMLTRGGGESPFPPTATMAGFLIAVAVTGFPWPLPFPWPWLVCVAETAVQAERMRGAVVSSASTTPSAMRIVRWA